MTHAIETKRLGALALLVMVALGGCDDGEGGGGGTPDTTIDGAAIDGAVDALDPDVGVDMAVDAQPDAMADALPDVMADAMPDAMPDATPDAMPDASPDAAPPARLTFRFTAADADPEATDYLGRQQALRPPGVPPLGRLVVYLHGAGKPNNCGSRDHGELLAADGFHVLMPCYAADYGVGNCGDAIGACRQEAFEGTDQIDVIDIGPPESIERRIVMGLRHLDTLDPDGGWAAYLDGEAPRYDAIIVSGHSHGASSAGLIGQLRGVARVVMLAGPLDSGQPWLDRAGLTPADRYYGFTHTGDGQHPGHLAAFEALGLPGAPTGVDDTDPPYGESHRLVSDLDVIDGHSAVQASVLSPMRDGVFVYRPVWRALYGVD